MERRIKTEVEFLQLNEKVGKTPNDIVQEFLDYFSENLEFNPRTVSKDIRIVSFSISSTDGNYFVYGNFYKTKGEFSFETNINFEKIALIIYRLSEYFVKTNITKIDVMPVTLQEIEIMLEKIE